MELHRLSHSAHTWKTVVAVAVLPHLIHAIAFMPLRSSTYHIRQSNYFLINVNRLRYLRSAWQISFTGKRHLYRNSPWCALQLARNRNPAKKFTEPRIKHPTESSAQTVNNADAQAPFLLVASTIRCRNTKRWHSELHHSPALRFHNGFRMRCTPTAVVYYGKAIKIVQRCLRFAHAQTKSYAKQAIHFRSTDERNDETICMEMIHLKLLCIGEMR